MITIGTVLIALLLFTAGGIVKGLLGVGLPMVAIPGLTLIVGLPNALAMVSVPVALANLWQVWQFRQAPRPWRRAGTLSDFRRHWHDHRHPDPRFPSRKRGSNSGWRRC